MKKVIIDESKLPLIYKALNESEQKMSFFLFFNEIKRFISDLLKDPINAKPSDILKSKGFDNNKLRKLLRDKGIIKMNEKIDEPIDEEGNAESMYYVSYKVPKKNFKYKIKRLYQTVI